MDTSDTPWTLGCGSFGIDPAADTDDLLNDAAEWLACARSLTDLLIDAMPNSELLDRQRLAYALMTISTLTQMGMQCAAHAHGRLHRSARDTALTAPSAWRTPSIRPEAVSE